MTLHNCELCGQPVRVVGDTTLHYEPAPEQLTRPGDSSRETGGEMSENTSLCWDCHEVRSCLQANARGTVACSVYKQQPHPPGPPRPPIGTYCADRLWANTPEHLHPKPRDQHRDERIKGLETTVLEQADRIESLSAECEQLKRAICDVETCKLVGELSDEIAGYLKLSDNLLVFVEWQAAKIERLTWAPHGLWPDDSTVVYCRHCGQYLPQGHKPGCPAGEE